MRTFKSKSLIRPDYVSLLKGFTLFFLGASVVVLATNAISIDPGINNLTQYIQKIVVTSASGTPVVTMNSGTTALEVNGYTSVKGTLFMNESNDILFYGNERIGLGRYTSRGSSSIGQSLALWGEEGGVLGTRNNDVEVGALYWNYSGNVGIGTSTPGNYKLKVMGSTYIEGGNLTVKNNGFYNDAKIGLNNNSNYWDFAAIGDDLNIGKTVIGYGSSNVGNINIINGETAIMTITSGGNVGIGTNAPGEKLQVNGNILFSNGATRTIALATGETVGNNLLIAAGKASSGTTNYVGGSLYLRGGYGYGGGSVYMNGGHGDIDTDGGDVYINGGNADIADKRGNVILANSYGNVGIGNTTPGAKLDVVGRISSSQGFISNGLTGYNGFIQLKDKNSNDCVIAVFGGIITSTSCYDF